MPRETNAAKRERAIETCRRLNERYGPVECFLDHETPFRLVIAVLLSAQTTDAQVNKDVYKRQSEALCVLALFTPAAVPGLTLGCAIANIANIALSGTGMLGMLDVVFGTLATFVGASITWKLRRRPAIALMGPVLANALIVPAYLPLLLQGIGFYTIPFTSISLDGTYPLMYLFGLVTTGLGEAVIMYLLGYPLARSLAKTPLIKRELAQTGTNR